MTAEPSRRRPNIKRSITSRLFMPKQTLMRRLSCTGSRESRGL